MISAYKKILDGVVDKTDARPILKGVHYQNGNMVATDSHQLVRFENVLDEMNGNDLNLTIDFSTYLPIEGNYPETDRLFPTENTTRINLHDINELPGLINYLKAGKKQVVVMQVKDSGVMLKLQADPGMTYGQSVDWDGEALKVMFYANYLYNALAYLDRLHKEYPLEYHGDVTINFNGELRPFTIVYGKMTYLICPVRMI